MIPKVYICTTVLATVFMCVFCSILATKTFILSTNFVIVFMFVPCSDQTIHIIWLSFYSAVVSETCRHEL